MDWGAWQVTVHGVCKESDTTEQLHFFPHSSLIGRRISKPSILMEETPWLWHLCLPPSLTQPLGQWGGFSGWEGYWTCSTLPGFGGLRSQHSAGSKRHPLHLSNSFAPTPSSAHGYRPLCLGFVSLSLADAQTTWPLPTVQHPLSVCSPELQGSPGLLLGACPSWNIWLPGISKVRS